MSTLLSPEIQATKIELLEWLANEENEILMKDVVGFIKIRHSENFVPMTPSQLHQDILEGIEDARAGRVTSIEDLREEMKTW